MSRFIRIQDIVNDRISLLVDTESGYYNATKTLTQFYELYPVEEGKSQKDVNAWTRFKGAKELIALVSSKFGIEKPIYDIMNGPNEYRGTYMCSKLYDSFLMWLDKSYGLDLLDVIEKHRSVKVDAITLQLNQITAERDEAITERDEAIGGKTATESALTTVTLLMAKLISDHDNDRKEAEKDRKEAEKDRKEAKQRHQELKFDLQKVKTDLTSKINHVADLLKEKSIHSTMDPTNENLVHNYVCMGYDFTDETGKKGRKLYHIAGQSMNVRNAMRKKYEDDDHDWKVVIQMHYSANPIDLRNNIKTRLNQYKASVVAKVNAKRVAEVDMYNASLKEEIKTHNKANPNNKRSYSDEKMKVKKISTADIPINARNKMTSSYVENEYITYDEYLDVVRGVDIETKTSPYQSEESDNNDDEK